MTIAYPMGIPKYDEAAQAISGDEDLGGTQDSKFVLDEDTCVIWFAGKMMAREQNVGKFISMENAICKVRVQARGSGAPQREVDTEARSRMMAMYHKKQQEQKVIFALSLTLSLSRSLSTLLYVYINMIQFINVCVQELEEDDDNAYLNSAWANPNSYKNSMHGIGAVRWR